jgi:integrase/recombinase XerD
MIRSTRYLSVVPSSRGVVQRISVDQIAGIPEEEIWLTNRKSTQTRRAYCNDVTHFMRTLNIRSLDELRRVDHRAVMAWEQLMREEQGSQASTVRRRLAALSSLFAHLVKFDAVAMNPVHDVERLQVNRREGMTLAFSPTQARAILDKPASDTQLGVRDRAILAVGLQVGFRHSEIAALKVCELLSPVSPLLLCGEG